MFDKNYHVEIKSAHVLFFLTTRDKMETFLCAFEDLKSVGVSDAFDVISRETCFFFISRTRFVVAL